MAKTVMVVDDEMQTCISLEFFLSISGYNVVIAPDAEQALGLAKEQSQGVDLLVTDQCMPGKDGLWLIQEMQELFPDISCLLVTAFDGHDLRRQLTEMGNFQLIQKPISLPEFSRVVAECLSCPEEELANAD